MSEISLYPDQQDLVSKIRKAWTQYKKFLVYLPTGGGKTRIAAYIINGMVKAGLKVCFVVPRISLIQQTANSFIDLGITDITYLWADMPHDPSRAVTIASAQTYIRRQKGDFDLTIIDECDIKAKQLLAWMDENPQDRYIGLTATPFAEWLGHYYEEIVKGLSMRDMIDQGRLAKYEMFAPSKPDMSGATFSYKSGEKDYTEKSAADAMDKPLVYGDIIQFWLENAENKLTIAGCVNQNHAKHLTKEFNRAGISAELIIDKTKINEREEIFKRAREGITKVLVSVDCLTEGFDMPEAEVLINARPTKSKRRYIQFLGRILRAHGDKVAKIFDHSGSVFELGYPEEIEIPDVLINKNDGMTEQQQIKKEIEKAEKLPHECPSCHYIKDPGSPPQCPRCGFHPMNGEDVPTEKKVKLKKLKSQLKDKPATMEEKQDWYAMLKGYQKQMRNKGKNYSDGYIAHLFRHKFNVWPNKVNRNMMKPPSVEVLNFIKAKNIRFAKSRARK